MPANQEELKNLCAMRDAFINIDRLQKEQTELTSKRSRICAQQIKEYPPFKSENRKEKIRSQIKEEHESAPYTASFISLLPAVAYGIYGFVSLCKTGEESFFDMVLYILLYFAPLLLSFVPYFGHFLSAGAHLLLAGFLALGGGGIYRDIFLISAAVLVGCYVIWWIVLVITKAGIDKKEGTLISEAERLARAEHEEYLRKKALAEPEIQRKKRELAAAIKEETAAIDQELAKINASIALNLTVLKETPGLADEDKNLYTIETLIRYFNRGKADSIKEAINIFDAEEHQKKVDARNHDYQLLMMHQQDLALMNMKAAQNQHNEEVKTRLTVMNHKIDDAIEELNKK